MPPVSRMRHLVLGEDFPAAKKGKCRQSSANQADHDTDHDTDLDTDLDTDHDTDLDTDHDTDLDTDHDTDPDPEPVQRHRRKKSAKRAQKNPGQKLASEKKKSLDKRNGMVYNGNPYCDSMPIYAIPYYMSILTQVAAVVKREVCEF